jgi:hypothetical protein
MSIELTEEGLTEEIWEDFLDKAFNVEAYKDALDNTL